MRVAAHLTQTEFDIRCEWGLHGAAVLPCRSEGRPPAFRLCFAESMLRSTVPT